jgi:putative ABC transport system permease protein
VAASGVLGRGDVFQVSHGTEGGGEEHEEQWTVVGVLRPTGTPNDRAIFIPIDSFYRVEGHGGEATEKRELTAIGVRLRVPELLLAWRDEFRRTHKDAQVILPLDQVRKLKVLVGDRDRAFRAMSWLAIAVALLGILVSLYTATLARRREIAILRALGARPGHVFSVIVLEALLLCLLGGAAGLLIGHVGAPAAAPHLLSMLGIDSYGVVVDAGLRPFDLQILVSLAVLGLLAGLLPAWRGLRTPVARNLLPAD